MTSNKMKYFVILLFVELKHFSFAVIVLEISSH